MHRALLTLGLVCALPLSAAPKPKAEKPDQALKRVAKAFAKLSSYRAEVAVTGGMARGSNHGIGNPSVDERYTLRVRGKLMRLEGKLVGFRLRGAIDGAAQVGDRWQKLLTPAEGRSMTRLCEAPEALLAELLRLKRGARYEDAPGAGQGPGEVVASVAGDDQVGTRAGGREGGASGRSDDELGPHPRHIVVEASGQVAVEHFERVLSSGCLLGGG